MKKIHILLLSFFIFTVNIWANSSKVFMLRDNGPLRKANDSNGVEWAETVRAGTELELESSEIIKKDLITTNKSYSDVAFYKVTYNKQTYYVQESDVEPADKLSVLQTDAVLFTRPSLSYFRNAILETGTFVVTGETIEQFGNKFVKIVFYDTIDGLKRTRFVNSNAISESDKDVKAIIILENARYTSDETLQKELLNNIKAINTSSLIEKYISQQTAKILNVSSFSDDSIISIEGYNSHISTEDDSKVNVRSLPGTAGEVIGQFESAYEPIVFVSMKTEDTEEIGGVTESWYYVSEVNPDTLEVVYGGIEGWVFGGYLK